MQIWASCANVHKPGLASTSRCARVFSQRKPADAKEHAVSHQQIVGASWEMQGSKRAPHLRFQQHPLKAASESMCNPVRGRTAALSCFGSFFVIVIAFINSINREFCPLRGRGESRTVWLRRWQTRPRSELSSRVMKPRVNPRGVELTHVASYRAKGRVNVEDR